MYKLCRLYADIIYPFANIFFYLLGLGIHLQLSFTRVNWGQEGHPRLLTIRTSTFFFHDEISKGSIQFFQLFIQPLHWRFWYHKKLVFIS